MTSPVTQVEFLVAEFLFVLCKENGTWQYLYTAVPSDSTRFNNVSIICLPSVSRLIKYTGYGNAAGLLAHRGLMMGHPTGHVSAYSSDSEDSGTEEYKQAEHRFLSFISFLWHQYLFKKISCLLITCDSINPITGSYEPERPNPLDQMSEEQKEYEAVKLVNMIDQLQRYDLNINLLSMSILALG